MRSPILVEACVDSVESAEAAQAGGADRIELCSALLEGGLTPSAGAIEEIRQRLSIAVHVMIRPRGADFCYSNAEVDVMRRDIDLAKTLGADGIVLGLLTPDGDVDVARARPLVERARPLTVTFHRAFDMATDPPGALETLIDLGVDRLLSSGQEATALEGVEVLRALVDQAGDRLVVMPGGGVTERNIARVLRESGAREIHVTGTRHADSAMRFRNPNCFMGGELRPPEFSTTVTDARRIAALVTRIRDSPTGRQ